MKPIRHHLAGLCRDVRGATAIEYGLIACLVSITIIVWATQIGQSVLSFFNAVNAGF